MPNYSYKARDISGKLVKGAMESENEDTLVSALREKHLYLIQAIEVKKEKVKKKTSSFMLGSIKKREIIIFTNHLSSVLSAGVPIMDGLADLVNVTGDRRFKLIIEGIIEDVRGGSSLSDSFSRFPRVFPGIYVNMVKAGESSGTLDNIMEALARYLEWQEDLTRDVRKASTYPAILIVAICGLVGAIFAFVFPKMTKVFVSMNVELPMITRVMMGISKFVESYWPVVLLAVFVAFVVFKIGKKHSGCRIWLDRIKLKIPVFGDLLLSMDCSRFSHHLALMWFAGLNVSDSFELATKVVNNTAISQSISRARESILAGATMAQSLKDENIFSSLVIRMIFVGEKTGRMKESLDNVTLYYNREIPARIKNLFAVLEPSIFVILSVVVMCLALSFYLPLYKSLGSMGK